MPWLAPTFCGASNDGTLSPSWITQPITDSKGHAVDSMYTDLVAHFYNQALTVNAETTPDVVLDSLLADDFTSVNGQGTKSKAALIGQVSFFWQLIPDLSWVPQDVVVSGDKVVVRSVASGSPKGEFMGAERDGSKAFTIDTIDIHTVKDGRIVEVHHLEDWATAIKQLQG